MRSAATNRAFDLRVLVPFRLRVLAPFRLKVLALFPVKVLALFLLLPGCAGYSHWPWSWTQRWPGPMEPLADPLPHGDADLFPPGPEEVRVLRHADPVQVRPAGTASSFPLSFYKKDRRVSSGSGVYCSPGGRAEVLWPGGSSIVLFGQSAGIVGSPSRGEPSFVLRQVDRVQVDLKQEDQVELIGGSHLRAHSGPFILDHARADVLRVKNQSKSAGQIAFRDAVIVLDPGQAIDLPLLSAGGKPVQGDAGLVPVKGPGFTVEYSGDVDVTPSEGAMSLRARGEHEIRAMGVRVRLESGEEARFGGFSKGALAPAPAPSPPAGAPAPR